MSRELRIAHITAADRLEILRLARLENRHDFPWPGLIARADGLAVAVISSDGSEVIADPFRPTAAVVRALQAVACADQQAPKRTAWLARVARLVSPPAAQPCAW